MSKLPTYIDGIASSTAIDSSGEIVDLKGLDISSLVGGCFNFEHKSDLPEQIVGKILQAKKIFSKDDCDNERHTAYWNKCQMPFLYVMGRLFDDKKPSAVEVAALFQDDFEHPQENDIIGFSVEGAKISKEGCVVIRSIARKITITNLPCNKQCIAEMIPVNTKSEENNISSLFKGELELFSFEPTYIEILEKAEENNKFKFESLSNHPGWKINLNTKNGTVGIKHDKHGTVAMNPTKEGKLKVTHNQIDVGTFENEHHATIKTDKYMKEAGMDKTENLKKALDAGSGLGAAPSNLTQGAALAKENLNNHKEKVQKSTDPGSTTPIAGGSPLIASEDKSIKMNKKEKSHWSSKADEAYKSWTDREKFKGYMQKRLPHLADGEIDAIGRVLALKKCMQKDEKMSKMYASHYTKSQKIEKGSDLMMASEEKKNK